MVWAISLPDIVYVYLSYADSPGLLTINACIFTEQFGYGFGFTAYMLYLIYFSRGTQQTAHYAICTAFMALGMMLPGMIAGWLQESLGYQLFFIWIMDMTNLNGYLVPKMAMKETHRPPVGRIGLQREKFLQENHSLLYDKMLLDGTLYSDLKQTEQRYWEQVEQTITKLLVSNPAPDKNNDPLGWTAHMNSLQAQAAELAMPIVTSL
jgi:hypothetical protein